MTAPTAITGIDDVDTLLGGLAPGRVYLVTGEADAARTALVKQAAWATAAEATGPGFVTLASAAERVETIRRRQAIANARVAHPWTLPLAARPDAQRRIAQAEARLSALALTVIGYGDIGAWWHAEAAAAAADFIADHVDARRDDDWPPLLIALDSMRERTSARRFAAAAARLGARHGCPVIASCPQDAAKAPALAADAVIHVGGRASEPRGGNRPDWCYDVDIAVTKNRYGPTGTTTTALYPEWGLFGDAAVRLTIARSV